jgi:hypothetical protein
MNCTIPSGRWRSKLALHLGVVIVTLLAAGSAHAWPYYKMDKIGLENAEAPVEIMFHYYSASQNLHYWSNTILIDGRQELQGSSIIRFDLDRSKITDWDWGDDDVYGDFLTVQVPDDHSRPNGACRWANYPPCSVYVNAETPWDPGDRLMMRVQWELGMMDFSKWIPVPYDTFYHTLEWDSDWEQFYDCQVEASGNGRAFCDGSFFWWL